MSDGLEDLSGPNQRSTSSLVQGDVLAGRCLPWQIDGHRASLDRPPALTGSIERDGPLDGSKKGLSGVVAKHESVTSRRGLHHSDHGVHEARRGREARNTAVSKADDLSGTTVLDLW